MPSPSDVALISDILWPAKLAAALFIGHLLFEYAMDYLNGPDDPDGYA